MLEPLIITSNTSGFAYGAAIAGVVITIAIWMAKGAYAEKFSSPALVVGTWISMAFIALCVGLAIWIDYFKSPTVRFTMTMDYVSCPSWPGGYQLSMDHVDGMRVDFYSGGRRRDGSYSITVGIKPTAPQLSWQRYHDRDRYVSCGFVDDGISSMEIDRIPRYWEYVWEWRRKAARSGGSSKI